MRLSFKEKLLCWVAGLLMTATFLGLALAACSVMLGVFMEA